MLFNPTLKAPQTTDTLYVGLQHINSGEVASAHRHSAFALRFIIEGEGGWTAVEGEKLYMNRGDVILTPRWEWHDHGKDGEGPMVWLDALDLPMFQYAPVNFTENYEDDRYPSKEAPVSSSKYPWADVQKYLDSVKGDYAIYTYESQVEKGKPLSTIIGGQAERVAPGTLSPLRHESSSFVYHVYEGKGHTVLTEDDGKETLLQWEQSVYVPLFHHGKFRLVNDGNETVIYSVSLTHHHSRI